MRLTILSSLLLFSVACTHDDSIEPQIAYAPREEYLKSLPSPFKALRPNEADTDWGKEYRIGMRFAEKLDLYPALTAFRRAECLTDESNPRQREINYYTLLCYYFGKKYHDVIETFETTSLSASPATFPPFNDLLLMIYEAYEITGQEEKANRTYQLINEYNESNANKIELGTALKRADITEIRDISNDTRYEEDINLLLADYCSKKKSVSTAGTLNAVLPGSGFLYLGQKQSAATAFALNSLFIAAAIHFFSKGNVAAGIITTSFEAGWYFGGIYGAKQNAKLYNERIWEDDAGNYMAQEKLFPILQLKYAF